jgi:hypothetical protein
MQTWMHVTHLHDNDVAGFNFLGILKRLQGPEVVPFDARQQSGH